MDVESSESSDSEIEIIIPPVILTCSWCKVNGHVKSQCIKLKRIICKKCKQRGHTDKFCTFKYD